VGFENPISGIVDQIWSCSENLCIPCTSFQCILQEFSVVRSITILCFCHRCNTKWSYLRHLDFCSSYPCRFRNLGASLDQSCACVGFKLSTLGKFYRKLSWFAYLCNRHIWRLCISRQWCLLLEQLKHMSMLGTLLDLDGAFQAMPFA